MRTTQTFKDNHARPQAAQPGSKQEVQAENHYRKLRKAGQTNQVQRHGPSEHKKRTRPKVAEYKTGHDHHEKPKEEKLFFHTHGHPPRPLASSAGPQGPAGTEENPKPS